MVHPGEHADPEACVAEQLPVFPLVGNNEGEVQSHGLAVHTSGFILQYIVRSPKGP